MKEPACREHWKKMLGSETWEVSRRTVSIAGRVTDVRTGRSINGIQVRLLPDQQALLLEQWPTVIFIFLICQMESTR